MRYHERLSSPKLANSTNQCYLACSVICYNTIIQLPICNHLDATVNISHGLGCLASELPLLFGELLISKVLPRNRAHLPFPMLKLSMALAARIWTCDTPFWTWIIWKVICMRANGGQFLSAEEAASTCFLQAVVQYEVPTVSGNILTILTLILVSPQSFDLLLLIKAYISGLSCHFQVTPSSLNQFLPLYMHYSWK